MEIKVLGTGCKNCKKLLNNVEKSVEELNIKVDILYVTDYIAIANTELLRTPGLMINDKIVSSGKVITVNEIKMLINKAI